MATIEQNLTAIRNAVYGKDVREAIANGIENCYNDVTTGATVANSAATSANAAATSANAAATSANAAAVAANQAAAGVEQEIDKKLVAAHNLPFTMESETYLNVTYQGIRSSTSTATLNGNTYTRYWWSGWIDVRGCDKVSFATAGSQGYTFRTGDRFSEVISCGEAGQYNKLEVNVPAGAEYFAFSANVYPASSTVDLMESMALELTSGNYVQFYCKGIMTGEKANKNAGAVNEAIQFALPPYEKLISGDILCIGDSLTVSSIPSGDSGYGGAAPVTFPQWLGVLTGKTVSARAKSGYSASRWWDDGTISKDFIGYGAFVLWLGTNNGPTTMPEGSKASNETDKESQTYFYRLIVEKIIADVPTAKIFLGAVFASTSNVNTVNSCIRAIAEKYPNNVVGVASLDDGTLFGPEEADLHGGFTDEEQTKINPHFSASGYFYLANKWLAEIRRLIGERIGMF